MTWIEFLIIFAVCALTMLICRVVPVFALKDKELPESVEKGLGFIPPATFAALVANDLFSPGTLMANPVEALLPIIAALAVVGVAIKTKSLIWCIIVGVGVYAFLLFAVAAL